MRRLPPVLALAAALLAAVGCGSPPVTGAATAARAVPAASPTCKPHHHRPCPSPSPTATSPTPAPTDTSPSPAPTQTSPSPSPTGTSPSPSPTGASPHKVMVIMEENHSRADAMAGMPYLASLAARYGQAAGYDAIGHPSLPNYLAIFGGDTFGVSTDCSAGSSGCVPTAPSVWGQTLAAGKTATAYQESMPSNCATADSGSYAPRHGPWPYWTDATERAGCNANDVPMGTLTSGPLMNDISSGSLPVTGEMTPDLCDDAHDCSLATADAWLNGWAPKLMAGPDYTAGNLTIIITFDEDGNDTPDNNVAFVVIDPRLSGKTVTGAFSHYSLTKWLEDNAGVTELRNAATAPDLQAAFFGAAPSPTPTATSPVPTPTSTSPTPTPTPTATTPASYTCNVQLGGSCPAGTGGYDDQAEFPMSNGYNTYVSDQDVGSNTGSTDALGANAPSSWSVLANQVPYGYGGVQAFPDTFQMFNDWCSGGTWWDVTGHDCASNTDADTPLASLSALKVNYSESMPRDANTLAEFASDVWPDNYPNDVMFWSDTVGRCNNGAYGDQILGTAMFGGQTWTVNRYGGTGAEIIFVLDSDPNVPDSCAQQTSGTIDVGAGLQWLADHGYMASLGNLGMLNTGWEICSAGQGRFTVNSMSYTVTVKP